MIDSANHRGRGRRAALPALALLLAFLVGDCSADEGTEPLEGAPTSSAPDPAAEAEVLETWEAYWTAVVEAENTADPEGPAAARLAELAAPPVVEGHLVVVRRYEGYGLQRVGEPELRDVDVQVDGDSARVTACVSEDDWGAEVDGEPVQDEPSGFHPTAATFEKTDGTWMVTGRDRPAGVRC